MAPILQDTNCVVCNGPPDLSSTDLDKKRTACRYFQTGNCRRGSNCPFLHLSIAGQPQAHSKHMYTYQPLGPTPVYRPPDSQGFPVFLWQPYTPVSPCFDPQYGFTRQETLPDYPDDSSDPSSDETSSTVASMDHRLRMAHDMPWSDRVASRSIQGTASPPEEVGVISSPGYVAPGYPVFSGVKAKHEVGRGRTTSGQFPGQVVTLSSPLLLSRQDDTRKKPLAYKTKPCKFYAANGKCTSGEKCTFIHDPQSTGDTENAHKRLAPPVDAKLPPKPLNKYDEYRARDFYPITWRVIGGGVMMGGQRQTCPTYVSTGQCAYGDDCKLAHETELESDLGFIEPKGELLQRPSRQPNKSVKRARSSSQRPKSIKVHSTLTPTPDPQRPDGCAPEDLEAARKIGNKTTAPPTQGAPTSPVHRRTRSMSMVLTSPISLDTTPSSYAAEL